MTLHTAFHQCADWIAAADGLLITGGAGIGVDSGLPDFRGREGFWRAYPALAAAGLAFERIANPENFFADPGLAWGFYGHRLALYRRTVPHDGFRILRDIAGRLAHGAFIFTSNVDGQFQKAGFGEGRIYECHGSIHWLQCMVNCNADVWRADRFVPRVDETRCRLTSPMPLCPTCGAIARPNILMFNDWNWLDDRAAGQHERMRLWLRDVKSLVTIEIGAGESIPTVRRFGHQQKGPLIRINPREGELSAGRTGGSLAMGGLQALKGIEAALGEGGFFANDRGA